MSDKSNKDLYFGSDAEWVNDADPSVERTSSITPKVSVMAMGTGARISIRYKVYVSFTVIILMLSALIAISLVAFLKLDNSISQITNEREQERSTSLEIKTNTENLQSLLNEYDLANLYQNEADLILSKANSINSQIIESTEFLDTMWTLANREIISASELTQFGFLGGIASIIVIFLVFGSLIYFVFERNIIIRLKNLHTSVYKISAGELEGAITVQGNDEISDLALAVEHLRTSSEEIDRLKQEQSVLETHSVERRRSSMLFLAESFENTVKSISDNLSHSVSNMSNNSNTMSRDAENNSNQVREVNDVVLASRESISTISRAISEINERTTEIGQRVSKSTQAALVAVEKSEQASITVQNLSNSVQKIGEVAEIIKTIADQTNLLALNASIEAARAGEAGRGFVVVAGEVKGLASQTTSATEEITEQIELVIKGTAATVEAISEMTKTVKEISDFTSVISNVITQHSEQMIRITNISKKVTDNSSAISKRVDNIVESSTKTEQGAKELLDSSVNLTDYIGQLSSEVERFLESIRED